jgi:hypothetical protein
MGPGTSQRNDRNASWITVIPSSSDSPATPMDLRGPALQRLLRVAPRDAHAEIQVRGGMILLRMTARAPLGDPICGIRA